MTARTSAISLLALALSLVSLLSTPGYANEKEDRLGSIVMFNGRLLPDEMSPIFAVPSDKILVITDVVIQNRAGGDEPVDALAFSRIVLGGFRITQPSGADIFFTVVGNNTLNLHFSTGMQVVDGFRVLNVINSSAPFIEFTITGLLTKRSGQPHR